ncbi:hormogonium polysaccharide secretion pseudopilin HpsC [Phormidium nigroviride]
MKNLLRLLLKSQQNRKYSEQNHSISGFTLTELLVAMIMTFLILTPLLTFVVDMVNTDRKEQLKANTEQEIQSAVDFISQDLSQAVYIYDKTGIEAIVGDNFIPRTVDRVPILVFWKRRLVKDSLPVQASAPFPKDCKPADDDCDDTYVSSLVAYYQFKEKEVIWCQPDSSPANCPTRIVRYEIKDGVRNATALSTDPDYPYYKQDNSQTNENQQKDDAFDPNFDLSNPNENVTIIGENLPDYSVLVNNIDQSTANVPAPIDCKATLGITDPAIEPLISDNLTNSFYACVDTSRNIARVYLRGNAMRRIYNDATYNANNPAFFPTATAQVKGLSSPGQ